MTEGIIKKVFAKFRKEHPNSLKERYWSVTINELEQELIEEIKKLDKPRWHSIWIEDLIGDNR